MSGIISVGFGNYVIVERAVAIVSVDSVHVRKDVQQAMKNGTLIDAAQGRKIKSVVYMDSGQIVASCLAADTLAKRAQDRRYDDDKMHT